MQVKVIADVARKLPEADKKELERLLSKAYKYGVRPESEVGIAGVTAFAVTLITKHAEREGMPATMESLFAIADKLEPLRDEVPPEIQDGVTAALGMIAQTFGADDAVHGIIDETSLRMVKESIKVN